MRASHRFGRFSASVVLLLVVGGILFLYSSLIKEVYQARSQNDFYIFYLSSSNALKGENPYWLVHKPKHDCVGQSAPNKTGMYPGARLPNLSEREGPHPNLNPPAWIALLKPLAYFEYNVAWIMYSGISIFFALVSVILISHELFGKNWLSHVLVIVLFFLYFPSYANVEYGQVSFILLLPLVLSWLSILRGRDWRCGFLLGFLAGLKIFFLLFAFSCLISKKWVVLFGMVVGFLLTIVFGGYFSGFEYYDDYLNVLGSVSWLASSWNASVFGFCTRILGGYLYDHPYLLKLSVVAISFFILAGLACIVRLPLRSEGNRSKLPDVIYGGTIPSMLLLSPLGWLYYFPLLIISLAIYCRNLRAVPSKRLYILFMLLALSMSSLPSSLVPACDVEGSVINVFFRYSLPFYSLIMLFITMLVVLWKKMGDETHDKTVSKTGL